MMSGYLPIRVVIADDHEIFLDGFAGMLKKQCDIILAGHACNGKELIEITGDLLPDVIVTDIQMPEVDGIEATKQILKNHPSVHVIALSMFNDDHYVVDMLEAGARGYLLKNARKAEIIDAIKTVYRGEVYYCRDTSLKLLNLMAKRKQLEALPEGVPPVSFSTREREIISLISRGFSNKEISDSIHLSTRTIEGYRESIQKKIKVKNAVGIVIYAVRNKMVEF